MNGETTGTVFPEDESVEPLNRRQRRNKVRSGARASRLRYGFGRIHRGTPGHRRHLRQDGVRA